MSATPVLDFAGVFADELLFTTGTKVGGGYDKNPPPCPQLWMTNSLWTIAEHVYDDRVTRQNKRTKKPLMQAGGHPIGVLVDHCSPDSGRIDTMSNCFVDRQVAQSRERIISRETARVCGAERLLESFPEIRQPHPTSLLRAQPDDTAAERRHPREFR
jgi:hypothetical protein